MIIIRSTFPDSFAWNRHASQFDGHCAPTDQKMPLATVGPPISSCQRETGSCEVRWDDAGKPGVAVRATAVSRKIRQAGQGSTMPSRELASVERVISAPRAQTAVCHIVHGDFAPVLAIVSRFVSISRPTVASSPRRRRRYRNECWREAPQSQKPKWELRSHAGFESSSSIPSGVRSAKQQIAIDGRVFRTAGTAYQPPAAPFAVEVGAPKVGASRTSEL